MSYGLWVFCIIFCMVNKGGGIYFFQGSTYTQSRGECCGKCTPTSCVESKGEMRGDTLVGVKLRQVSVYEEKA